MRVNISARLKHIYSRNTPGNNTTGDTMRYLILIVTLYISAATAESSSPAVIGWIEPIRILPEVFDVQAKIDTGADNSSLGVLSKKSFMRDGKEWIQFEVRNNDDQTQTFERPLKRYTLIKRKGTQPLKRPVVEMWLCIGKDKMLVPVNLAKRENFKYRMLIGRSLLKGRYLVDSAQKMTSSPDCDN